MFSDPARADITSVEGAGAPGEGPGGVESAGQDPRRRHHENKL